MLGNPQKTNGVGERKPELFEFHLLLDSVLDQSIRGKAIFHDSELVLRQVSRKSCLTFQ